MRSTAHFIVCLVFIIAMTTSGALLPGCMTYEGGYGYGGTTPAPRTGPGFNLLSTQEEVAMGQQLAAEIEQQERVLIDPQLQSYINEIGQRLLQGVERTDLTYQFKLIDAPDTVNAFALPGGFMYIYTGLLKFCDDEGQLTSVMAHEIAHVAAFHHGESLTRQYGAQLLMSIVLGKQPSQTAQIAASLIGNSGMMYFSRQQEYEADAKGIQYLVRAGYPPATMAQFMAKLAMEEGGSGAAGRPLLKLFSTHPPTQERLARINAMAQQYPAPVPAPDLTTRYQREIARI